ncbi:MAG: 30S ribosomal protein S3 [Candidatus Amesbacteria bacterium GW2011_GWB1_47_26]|uniref:Small ribosomal subunit protein uS3 n=2 Tax=root TaxID=1 RepID=A0A0G1M4E8_9BACT|nr:30S ribosomal protein S3 [uncultured organism]KKU03086.1 MAG: 30S ribosomal protein S3 [Candidatus Amesbacteria bacterium GW2011_GWC2_45_19]KKU38754.1 MAG: 30S ribosomal protein S3 [Candidatus Amesbacteria bacterium GW2011_GWA1_46_35]KKU69256.1 MAG: 30S ribosomal protein S3 [Microgenomates group bacterium GW2011_GWC1_47_20]KKU75113.1 MAG: 30S ribosomal protein S3 [Candidatus Amesbacteria bacterium GW2011_GWB1_47_26]KKU80410.1 MAG: 30S ribosomal protein S3 [Candidatus Amesbacteria bacterium 
MGNKVNPVGYRLPLSPTATWKSRWFTTNPKKYREYLAVDVKLRKALMEKLRAAGVTRVNIERSLKSLKVTIFVTRPGVVIGRGGAGIDDLKRFISKTLGRLDLRVDQPQIEEVKFPDLNAHLVASKIAEQIERRLPARRVAKKSLERTMQAGAKGIKILIAGRINGAEISRRELYHEGSVPLQTLRADVDYAQIPALTRSGYVGVKVWINRGETNYAPT